MIPRIAALNKRMAKHEASLFKVYKVHLQRDDANCEAPALGTEGDTFPDPHSLTYLESTRITSNHARQSMTVPSAFANSGSKRVKHSHLFAGDFVASSDNLRQLMGEAQP